MQAIVNGHTTVNVLLNAFKRNEFINGDGGSRKGGAPPEIVAAPVLATAARVLARIAAGVLGNGSVQRQCHSMLTQRSRMVQQGGDHKGEARWC